MNYGLHSRFWTALSLFALCTLSSCINDSEENCPDSYSFIIESNWTDCPEASPEGMAYMFFPSDGSTPWRFDFPGRTAGKVNMRIGEYKVLSFNDDTYNILFRGDDSYSSFELYTPESKMLKSIPKSEWNKLFPESRNVPVVDCPDMVWGSAYYSFSLLYDGIRYTPSSSYLTDVKPIYSPKFLLIIKQHQITPRYTYTIKDVKNLSGVKSMSAALSGMAGSMLLASGKRGNYPSTIAVNATSTDSTTISGNFCTFGVPQKPTTKNILSLFVVLKDGHQYCYQFDVTGQIRSAPDPMNVNLLLKNLILEKPESGSSTGFDVNVDGWETIIVNITD